jgi:hypothetical protein
MKEPAVYIIANRRNGALLYYLSDPPADGKEEAEFSISLFFTPEPLRGSTLPLEGRVHCAL